MSDDTPVTDTHVTETYVTETPVTETPMKDVTKPTICFATMCKNEEHCIQETLESVYKYIDYWVVHDTGSTDSTCQIVKDFFAAKNIPGELFISEFEGFDINKTKLFDRCYGKTDYIMHLDADDLLCGNFSFPNEDRGYLKYNMKVRRGGSEYKCSILFDNSVQWKFVGVAHNIIVYLSNPKKLKDTLDISERDFYYQSRDTGKRSEDKEKYLKDAIKLKDQFFRTLLDDPHGINNRSVFYCAQSYFDQCMYKEAAQWYMLYTKLKDTWEEEHFEANLRLITCFEKLKYPLDTIIEQGEKTIRIYRDRAEPYFILGKFLNDSSRCDLAYPYLNEARQKNLDAVNAKYSLFVRKYNYGKHINDELAVACYWTKHYEQSKELILAILNDPEFFHSRERLLKNLEFTETRMRERASKN